MNEGKVDSSKLMAASSLSALFTAAILYATLILPQELHGLLLRWIPDYGLNWAEAEATIETLRPLGYLCLSLLLLLIALGLLLSRPRMSALGSLALYLPALGHFASTMFFLAGLGVLRVVWLPMMELFPEPWGHRPYNIEGFLDVADVVYLPYILLRLFLQLPHILGGESAFPHLLDLSFFYALVLLGSALLFLGSQAWLYGRFERLDLIDFWIYRYSRHPQYLGLLIWSYALLIYDRFVYIPVKGGYFPAPSLLWLLTAIIILATALKEELEMAERFRERYVEYRRRTPFMMPLPRWLSHWIAYPSTRIIRKAQPESSREIALIVGAYTALIVGASILLPLPR